MKKSLHLLGLICSLMVVSLGNLFAQEDNIIKMTTEKEVGETIVLSIVGDKSIWIEGVKEERSVSKGFWDGQRYTLTAQTIILHGNVRGFRCEKNQVTELDVTACSSLTELWCWENKLTSLDLSKNSNLLRLRCSSNPLKTLDVSHNEKLERLHCDKTGLNTIDLSHNKALLNLQCSNNQLNELNLSQNTALEGLWCFNNKLNSINLSNNVELLDLSVAHNQLSSLDISKNTKLYSLNCENNKLSSLDLRNNPDLYTLNCRGNKFSKKAMSDLIMTLNANNDDKTFYPIYTGKNRTNICTPEQVQELRARGWKVQNESDVAFIGDYYGVEDNNSETTAVETLEQKITCYPNPTIDFVRLAGLEANTLVSVYAISGELVNQLRSSADGRLILDFRHLMKGYYFIKANDQVIKLHHK